MKKSKEKITVKLDPQIQELYALLEEERKKNLRMKELENENSQLYETIDSLKQQMYAKKEIAPEVVKKRAKKKLALHEQLQEKKLQDDIIENKQNRIENLRLSLSNHRELHEYDSKSFNDLKSTLDSLVAGNTKRVQLVNDLSKKNDELLEENEELRFMRSKFAHDLRSLMASIISTLSLIDLEEKETLEMLIPLLEKKCYVFMNLVNVINTNEISLENINIDDIVELLNLDVENHASIKIKTIGNDVHFPADQAAFYDVIQNLLNNSIKYSGISPEELIISIDVSQDEQNTTIKIADNGTGIQGEKQSRIFDLYNRGGRSDNEGQGIGLFMVKQIIESHQGTILYDQEFKEGAQFIIHLPR